MDFPLMLFLGRPVWMKRRFLVVVAALLAFNPRVPHKEDHETALPKA